MKMVSEKDILKDVENVQYLSVEEIDCIADAVGVSGVGYDYFSDYVTEVINRLEKLPKQRVSDILGECLK